MIKMNLLYCETCTTHPSPAQLVLAPLFRPAGQELHCPGAPPYVAHVQQAHIIANCPLIKDSRVTWRRRRRLDLSAGAHYFRSGRATHIPEVINLPRLSVCDGAFLPPKSRARITTAPNYSQMLPNAAAGPNPASTFGAWNK